MIQVTAIPDLNPYHRLSPIADFTTCPACQGTYQPGMRLALCPHPIISPRHLFPACTQIVVHTGGRKPTGPRPPLVLEEPEWEQQHRHAEGLPCNEYCEEDLAYAMFVDWRDAGPRRSLMATARRWQAVPGAIKLNGDGGKDKVPANYSSVRKIAERNKWNVRLQQFNRHNELIRLAIFAEEQKKRAKQDFAVIDTGRQIVASEMREILRTLQKGQSLGLPFDMLVAGYEKLVKLGRLISDQSTEHIVTEGAEIIRERKLRDAVTATQDQIITWKAAHPDASPEDVAIWEEHFISMNAAAYEGVERAQLAATVLGMIDDSSTAMN